jgi:hypothetical protein
MKRSLFTVAMLSLSLLANEARNADAQSSDASASYGPSGPRVTGTAAAPPGGSAVVTVWSYHPLYGWSVAYWACSAPVDT